MRNTSNDSSRIVNAKMIGPCLFIYGNGVHISNVININTTYRISVIDKDKKVIKKEQSNLFLVI
ncbi:MAG TPA: hypothetical protein OIM45_01080 [Clostridiaceae bacterium]|nr:hypothetical protein [Clostridiaceae bacterium]